MTIKCEVTSVSSLTNNTYRILLKPEQPVSYKAGQYLLAVMGEKDKRPFSIASSPCRQNGHELELHIGAAEENAYAMDVVKAAQAALEKGDDSFLIEAPHGEAWLRQERQRPLVLIAGGTGFSYVRSMLDHCLSQGFKQPIFLYWGGRDISQLYANDEMEALALKNSLLTYIPVVENTPQGWVGKEGNVLQAVMEDFVSLSAYDVYIAGRFEMAGAAREMFCTERGAERDHLFGDAFAFL
ncbi:NAD(P)H-flavin reductase [Enterovibrio norvegicus FF-33]|uniref:NAD(P)H-flavin reductase n=1 Tax=Enterovibrio norvegicus TaxID=188144 RepID=UPI00030E410E|nr:NAD(P)H-flavin reductase [Enterovibrio norvegicus]OEE68704.1 NAD(P)H-flavin reductase [Enterovibrio norvegicus FF-33]OEE84258.1 NAD(P)H-flavin reductase [Enterovibrio norvegicus FF-162]